MRAAVIDRYGSPDVITIADIPRPEPAAGQVLVHVHAAGVGSWDALIREAKSVISLSLPITLGSDIAGVVHSVGRGVTDFQPGDEVYGVTNPEFIGGYAEYALASAGMIARKPASLNFREAASVPVVAVTAWQMLFEYADLKAGQTALVQGGAGNVGAYAVQLARRTGIRVFATAGPRDLDYVRALGADVVIDYASQRFEDAVRDVDAVFDTVAGDVRQRSFAAIRRGGTLVSAVSPISADQNPRPDIKAVFFLVEVTQARLNRLTPLFDNGELKPDVGTVLPLEAARTAHLMLAGMPHKRGKIVLDIEVGGGQPYPSQRG
jgi:NADPH:quinone reductase-like Zn-dependent oxidoreductase